MATSNAQVSDGSVSGTQVIEFVLKLSKQCNLRCLYCYEFRQLDDPARMSLDQLAFLFESIASRYDSKLHRIAFVWHGGEPLLIPTDYYKKIFALQASGLGGRLAYSNSIQTNLTRLSDEALDFLAEGHFSHIGVSADLVGDLRVDRGGRPVDEVVLRNMDRLRSAGVPFGVIVVLSKRTAPFVQDIFEFFDQHGISMRFLPVYRSSFAGQQEDHALDHAEVVEAFSRLADQWTAAGFRTKVEPLAAYFANVVRHAEGRVVRLYDRGQSEKIKIVDTDGWVFSNADAYDCERRHINAFQTPLTEEEISTGWQRSLVESRRRVADACVACPFYGACSGFYMAEATELQRAVGVDGRHVCGIVRPLQEYISRLVSDSGT